MSKLSYLIVPIMAALYFGSTFSPALAKNIKIGLQIGHFSPQDWIIQERFNEGDAPYDDGFPYFRYSGFGDGMELQLNVQYDLGLWGLRLDIARRSMSDEAILYDFFSSYDRRGEMTIYSAKSFLIHRLSGENKRISPYLGVGTGIYFADFEVTLTDRFYPGWPPFVHKASSTPVGVSFLAGFDYALAWNFALDCEIEYDFAESDWRLKTSNSAYESEIRNLNIGGTTIRIGIGYGL